MTPKYFFATLVTAAIFISSNISANAEQIKLIAHDGTAEVTGELVSFVDDIYTISTPIGSIQMRASQVSCIGEHCPTQVKNAEGTPLSQ